MQRGLRVLSAATVGWLALGAAAEARTIYVSNEQGNTISVVDGDSLELVQEVEVGERPRGIVLSPDGKFLYVCASEDDTVQTSTPRLWRSSGSCPPVPTPR